VGDVREKALGGVFVATSARALAAAMILLLSLMNSVGVPFYVRRQERSEFVKSTRNTTHRREFKAA
jgi:hypothetical protein